MLTLLPETRADVDEVEALLDTCFAPGRSALSSYRLRDGVAPVAGLCRLIRDDYGVVVAAIRFWPVTVGAVGAPALLLGPVATHPTRQGEGLGAALILDGLERAREAGWRRVVLVGDEPFYRRFGFTREAGTALDYPPPVNPDRLLARELVPGGMEGVSGMVGKWPEGRPVAP